MPTFTIEQIADELQVSVCTVKRWIAQGKLKVIRLGYRTARITEEELERINRESLQRN